MTTANQDRRSEGYMSYGEFSIVVHDCCSAEESV